MRDYTKFRVFFFFSNKSTTMMFIIYATNVGEMSVLFAGNVAYFVLHADPRKEDYRSTRYLRVMLERHYFYVHRGPSERDNKVLINARKRLQLAFAEFEPRIQSFPYDLV